MANTSEHDSKQSEHGLALIRFKPNELSETCNSMGDSGANHDGDDARSVSDEAECESMITSKTDIGQIETDHSPERAKLSAVNDDRFDDDGGYGWVIVVCALFIFMMYGANWVLFSVYIVDFSEVFDKPQAYISVIGSIDTAMSQFTALPAGAFVSMYGCRPVCLFGLLIYTIGTLSSAFTTNFYTLVLTFGFVKGLGAGIIFIPCSVIVQQYFHKRRAMAVAFSTSGSCLGTMIFSPVHRLLIQTFGWRGGLIFFSAIVLQCTVCAALMRPPNVRKRSLSAPMKRKSSDGNVAATKNVSRCDSFPTHFREALSLKFLKNPKLLLFLPIKAFGATGNTTAYKFCIARAVHQGVDKFYASFLVTAIGLNSCFIFDVTQSYTVPYLFGGALQVVASCMGFVIMFLNRREKRHLKFSTSCDVK
ncbi:hypothetical protein LSH36_112g05105 [Paralvinella palmiformis]|uniref:Major facilitator superfamily (MFS) profile domain-containing protein n=1 Tax=Paralvinella palmiformis TaxID=53620 RepID=A0AAD9JYM0_9ANNE|nr:hypothetical protein LSH36_112g05105 [Paralvinella palmiformis]